MILTLLAYGSVWTTCTRPCPHVTLTDEIDERRLDSLEPVARRRLLHAL
jgi:hypothetical protein